MPVMNRQVLNKAGMRVTTQRALIMEIIRRGKGHLDADEIYRRAREKGARLSLSTVYRTLHTFKDEDHHHYEVKPATEHHHLLCLGCGRVIEFSHPLSLYIKMNVPEAKGFDVVDTEVRMTGYCPRCRHSGK